MKNLVFVIWMLGFPLVGAISDHLAYADGARYSEGVKFPAAVILLTLWFGIGKLLYERRKS